MAPSHRNNDCRACGGMTQVVGQDFVKINGQLWAVEGDTCSHGDGQIHSESHSWVTINGKGVICEGNDASQDDLCPTDQGDHCNPKAQCFDNTVDVKE